MSSPPNHRLSGPHFPLRPKNIKSLFPVTLVSVTPPCLCHSVSFVLDTPSLFLTGLPPMPGRRCAVLLHAPLPAQQAPSGPRFPVLVPSTYLSPPNPQLTAWDPGVPRAQPERGPWRGSTVQWKEPRRGARQTQTNGRTCLTLSVLVCQIRILATLRVAMRITDHGYMGQGSGPSPAE